MCIFCDIVAGRRESHRVFQDGLVVAFLDARPLFPGHTLAVDRFGNLLIAVRQAKAKG